MIEKSSVLASVLISILILVSLSTAVVSAEESRATIYFFWGDGCPHCANEKPFLERLEQDYPQLEVKSYETWYNRENAELFSDMSEAFGTSIGGVPTTFLDDKVWIGYSESIATEIEDKVRYCIEHGCTDPAEKIGEPAGNETVSKNPESVSPLNAVCVHAFLKAGCPQCESIIPYIDNLTAKYNVELKKHDVSLTEEKALYDAFKETYGFTTDAYPTVFIGSRFLMGEKAIRENLESEIISCSEKECTCPAENIHGLAPYPPQQNDITPDMQEIIDLPLIGKLDASKLSLPVFTIILGGLDSFNPCAFFVLFFLLSMLIYAKSRKRMLLIGGTFVFFSGAVYFMFMAAWLNLFLLIGQLAVITTIAGIVALIVAAINIKDFFFFGKGISLVIPAKSKPKLFARMRALLKATSVISMMIGTIVLAIAANSYELLCTAGFPMVFARILTLHELSTAQYYFYLALYNVVYVIPLAFIVLTFTLTLGKRKLTEWQGRILKLISGIMMLCLGFVLLIKPALMNNVAISAGLLGTALAIAGIIILVTKKSGMMKEAPPTEKD